MPARKMRVELFDSEGNRYTIAFEGQITRDKAVRLLDLVELLGGIPEESSSSRLSSVLVNNKVSKFEKVRSIVQKSFALIWFSSRDVQTVYETELKEPISLSTVSTYLSRMVNRGLLLRVGASNNLKYKIGSSVPHATVTHQTK